MSKILVTGFGNFGNIDSNPSETLVNLLERKYGINTYIFKGYEDIDDNLKQLLDRYTPAVILMFGLASRTPYIRLEQIANRPDKLDGQKIYRSTLPLRSIFENLVNNGFETAYSNDAGKYYCNYLFYKVSQLNVKKSHLQYGLVHIPKTDKYEFVYKKQLDLLKLGSTIVDALQ